MAYSVRQSVKMCKLNCHQGKEHTVLTLLQYVNKLSWTKPLIDLKLCVCLVVLGISFLQGYIMLQYLHMSVAQQDFGIVHWPSLRASRSLRRSSALLSRSLNSRCSFCCSRNFRSRSRWRSICSNRSLWPNYKKGVEKTRESRSSPADSLLEFAWVIKVYWKHLQ